MDLIQGIWPAWLGLEKRDFKFTGTGASTSVPSVYNIINHFLFLFQSKSLNLEMLRLLLPQCGGCCLQVTEFC
jgi:hypothetical protein